MAAGFLFIDDQDKMLLLKRSKHFVFPNHWDMPGGSSETGESPMKTAIRETKEEIGFLPDVISIEEYHVNCYTVFVADVAEQFNPILSDEHSSHLWVRRNYTIALRLHPVLKQLLR